MPAFVSAAGEGDVLLRNLVYGGLISMAKRAVVMQWEAGEDAAMV